jgi:hypothetical protein
MMEVRKLLALSVLLVGLVSCSKSVSNSSKSMSNETKPPSEKVGTQVIRGEIAVLSEFKSPAGKRLRLDGAKTCDGSDAAVDSAGKVLGNQVKIRNPEGEIIGVGAVSSGSLRKVSLGGACLFTFESQSLPVVKFYTLETANHGSLTLSREELEASGWKVGFTAYGSEQTLTNDLVEVRKETALKQKDYDKAADMQNKFDDIGVKTASLKEKAELESLKPIEQKDESDLGLPAFNIDQ